MVLFFPMFQLYNFFQFSASKSMTTIQNFFDILNIKCGWYMLPLIFVRMFFSLCDFQPYANHNDEDESYIVNP
jgi:hypothetical protein